MVGVKVIAYFLQKIALGVLLSAYNTLIVVSATPCSGYGRPLSAREINMTILIGSGGCSGAHPLLLALEVARGVEPSESMLVLEASL